MYLHIYVCIISFLSQYMYMHICTYTHMESDGMGCLQHASHFPDRNSTPQPQNGPRSVKVAEFSSKGHVGIVQYSAGAAAYKGVLMHTDQVTRGVIVHLHHETLLACCRPCSLSFAKY